jgi:hypothetical protein
MKFADGNSRFPISLEIYYDWLGEPLAKKDTERFGTLGICAPLFSNLTSPLVGTKWNFPRVSLILEWKCWLGLNLNLIIEPRGYS